MEYRKRFLSMAGALALGLPALAGAQGSDSGSGNTFMSGLWGWDDSSSADSRPRSWIPYTSYGYVGVGVGPTEYDLPSCAPGFSCDDTTWGGKVFTGGKFSRLLGVEAGYVYLGNAQLNGGHNTAQGVNVSLVLNAPIGDWFNLYGKVGGIYGWTRSTGAGASSGEEHGLNPSYGAGVQFDLNRNWAIAGDWDHYRFDYRDRNDDAQLYSINLIYKY